MYGRESRAPRLAAYLVPPLLALTSNSAWGQLNLGPGELVQAGGTEVDVPGYSVPSFVRWDDDSLNDLIVGEGPSPLAGKVRVYLNTGTSFAPQFSTYFYAQSGGLDLSVPASG